MSFAEWPHEAGAVLLTRDGQWHGAPPHRPKLLLPGAFDPVHEGHWGLARIAEEMAGEAVDFEISLVNVDKPELPLAEGTRRAHQFRDRAAVWLTRAPRFLHKARIFAGATFVLGADTAARLVSPRYYGDDAGAMHSALAEIFDRDCRFLVAARIDSSGRCLTLGDLSIPAAWRERFTEIPESRFRLDVSSTQLRGIGERGASAP